ncbi:MAG: VanZ family protein [Clostridiales bacterium]|nr:VanZ family protein [Clostridiales bacterium]
MGLAGKIYSNLTPAVLIICFIVIAALLATVILARMSVFNRKIRIAVILVFVVYMAGFLYVTLFSREPSTESTIVLTPFEGYRQSLQFNPGFIDFLKLVFHKEFSEALNTVRVTSVSRLEENLLNILLFVPFGFLVPTMGKKLRKLLIIVFLGMMSSLAVELVQFFTGLGIFDIDDLLNNTIGAFIGYILFFFCIKFVVRDRKAKAKQYIKDNPGAPRLQENDLWDDITLPEHVGRKVHEHYKVTS